MIRFVRYGPQGRERPGLLGPDDLVHDASSLVSDWSGEELRPERLAALQDIDLAPLPLVSAGARLGPPVAGTSKIIGVGLNYADHAREAGLPVPARPVWFLKPPSALAGPNDPILRPPGATKLDWEVEIGVVIGRGGRDIPRPSAGDHIAGLLLAIDVSEREMQLEHGGQWSMGKSYDSFAPVGPWLLPWRSWAQARSIELVLDLNKHRMQEGCAAQMVFDIETLIASISTGLSLAPGDILLTGTPPGVGLTARPPRFLEPGDRLIAKGTLLGAQKHVVEQVAA